MKGKYFPVHYDEVIKHEQEVIVNNEKNDKSIITLIEQNQYFLREAVSYLRELFNQYDDTVQDFLNRIHSSPKLREEFEKLKQKEQIEQKKRNFLKELLLPKGIRGNGLWIFSI
jgi:hypothetical protein